MKQSNSISVLFVDDEDKTRKHFSRAFSNEFNIYTAASVQDARCVLDQNEIAILIADERMPQQSGVSLLTTAFQKFPHIVRLLTTAYTDFDKLSAAINKANVFRFVSKPWNLEDLRKTLQDAADHYFLHNQQQSLIRDNKENIKNLGTLFSHEFSSPLLSIDLNVKILDTYLQQLFLEHPEHVLCNTHLTQNDLLKTSSRIQAAVVQIRSLLNMLSLASCDNFNEMHFHSNSMAECVQDALDYYPFAGHEHERVTFNIDNDFVFYGSKELMTVVLFNLLKNALRAITAKNTGMISITLSPTTTMNKLIFRDTGIGIAPKDLPVIFQDDFTTKKNMSGLGLGLCRKILSAFNGRILCQSEEGAFTEFTLELPHPSQ